MSDLVGNPEDRFSREAAYFALLFKMSLFPTKPVIGVSDQDTHMFYSWTIHLIKQFYENLKSFFAS